MVYSTEDHGVTEAVEKPSFFRLYMAVSGSSLLLLSAGAVMAWSSPMLPKLKLTANEETLVASLYSLGAAPGPFVVTFCLDTIGRKGTLYTLLATYLVSWVLLFCSQNINVIYIARLIGGIGVGGACSGTPLFVSEMAITEIRGRLGILSFAFLTVGSLITFIVGPLLTYNQMSIYGFFMGILFAVAFYFVPESPYYYVKIDRLEDAKASLKRLRGFETDVALEAEMKQIKGAVYQEQGNAVSFSQGMKTKAAKKALVIGLLLVLIQQETGGGAISAFCQQIYGQAQLNFDPAIVPVIMTLSSQFNLVSVVIVNSCLTVKRAYIISGIGNGLFLGVLGVYFYLVGNGYDLTEYSYLSVVTLVLCTMFGALVSKMVYSTEDQGVTEAVEKPSFFRLYMAVSGSSLLLLSAGVVTVWSSPMLPKLKLTADEETLVASLYSLGAAPGPFVVTFCLDTIGRKGTLYTLLATYLVSWVLLFCSQNINVIYIARLIGGIGVGGACSGTPLFVSEMAITEIRGRLGILSFSFMTVGSLITYCIGPSLTYNQMSIYGFFMGILFAVAFYFVPESPYYYVKNNRLEDAKASLKRLRGFETDVALEAEMKQIKGAVYQEQGNAVSFSQGMKTKAAKKALVIGLLLVLIQQETGGCAIAAFCQQIYGQAQLNFDPAIVPVIMTLSSQFNLVSVVIVNSCLTVKRAYIISGIGNGLFLGVLGVYFYLVGNGYDLTEYSYLSVLTLVLCTMFGALAVIPATWLIVAEILPPSIKGLGIGICGCFSSLMGFIIISLFSTISNYFGYSTSFFLLSIILTASMLIAMFIVPDTTGNTFQEIQEILSK